MFSRDLSESEVSPAMGNMSHGIIERRFAGLISRRPRWGISARGWLTLFVFMAALIVVTIIVTFPFLAVTERVPTDSLVVEGWVHSYAIRCAAAEYRSGGYRRVYTTGGPIGGMGGYTNDYNTSASVAAGLLRAAGVPADVLEMVPTRVLDRNRTYASAIALRDYYHAHGLSPSGINIVTEAPHARRSRLLFQKAFGSETKVGIIAIENPDYNSARWWEYSEGVKDVPVEALAYLYARLFFWPR